MTNAQQIRDPEQPQYHIAVRRGDVAPFILLVGDPDRADQVATRFDSIRFSQSHRGYHIYTGRHQKRELSVMCVGMGAGAMEIALVELCQVVDRPTLIRAGSCGALQPDVRLGDLVISQGAFRGETASLGFVEPGFPAVAHPEAVLALVQAAEEHSARYHVGITATAAGFYGAQGRKLPGFPSIEDHLVERLARQGVKNLEMETSVLFTLAALQGLRAGAVCAVFADRARDEFIDDDARREAEARCVAVGLGALHHLARMSEEARGGHWHPGLSQSRP